MNSIGEVIRLMRKAAGMTQMMLADKVGVSYQQIQKYEKGASQLNVPRLLQFAKIFNVPFTDIIGGNGAGLGHVVGSHLKPDEAHLLTKYREIPAGTRRLILGIVGYAATTTTKGI